MTIMFNGGPSVSFAQVMDVFADFSLDRAFVFGSLPIF